MPKPVKILAAVVALVLGVGCLYWLALGVAKERENELREELAEQERAKRASSEKWS